jgi:hypothetical protein
MQLLIGYLVALAVFLGGGYAGVQWLLTPGDPAALAQNSRAESASARLVNAKKIRDARALHRKQAETLAEAGVKPATAAKTSEAVADSGEAHPATIADHSQPAAAAEAVHDAAMPETPGATVAAKDPKLARAELNPAVTTETIKPVRSNPQAEQKPAAKRDEKTGRESGAAKKPVEAKAAPSEPAAARREAAVNKKQAASKSKRVERIASSSRRPIMMILRTIEFPDGRREQRLLPMSQAHAALPRYGSVSAFADDDDF